MYEGYPELSTGRIGSSPGKKIRYEDRDNFISVGYGMVVLFNSSGNYLHTQKRVAVVPPEDEYVWPNLNFEDIGEAMKQGSLASQVQDLEGLVFGNLQRGILEEPDYHFVNSKNTMAEVLGKVRIPSFGMQGMITIIIIIVIVIILIVMLCCCCRASCKINRSGRQALQEYAMLEMGAKPKRQPRGQRRALNQH